MSEKQPALDIFIENRCHQCFATLKKPPSLLSHMNTQHQIYMQSRVSGRARPKEEQYRFVSDKSKASEIHVGCPSCWFHCPETSMQEYIRHIQEEHSFKSYQGYTAPDAAVDDPTQQFIQYPPDDKEQLRTAAQNEIMDALDLITNSFKKLFNMS